MAQLNPFEIFGLPVKFNVDGEGLETKFIEIQKRVHPDKFANATDAEKRVAQQWTILINEAYQKLKDPLSRGKLICELKGHKVNEDSSGSLDEDFLLDQLERREKIDDAISSGDTKEVEALKKAVNLEEQILIGEIQKELDELQDYGSAAVSLQKLMFLNRQSAELLKG